MKKRTSINQVILAIGLLAFSSSLHAAQSNRKPGWHQQKQEKSALGRSDQPNLQKTEDASGFFLEYLLMRSMNGSLYYATDTKRDQVYGAFGNLVNTSSLVAPTRTWRPGMRIGFGADLASSGWDCSTDWTYYYNKSVTNKTMPNILLNSDNSNTIEGYYPYWAVPVRDNNTDLVLARYQNMQGVWQLNYNMINLEFGHPTSFSETFHVRPHVGIQNGWIHQKVQTLYQRSLEDTTPATEVFRDQLSNMSNNFWGIGLRAGLEGVYRLKHGFQFLGKVSGSLLTGRTKNRRTQSTDFQGGKDFQRVYNATSQEFQYAPGIQAFIGLDWNTKLSYNSSSVIGFSTGWEMNYWWGQFKFLKPKASPASTVPVDRIYFRDYPNASGPLYIEGVTVRGYYDF